MVSLVNQNSNGNFSSAEESILKTFNCKKLFIDTTYYHDGTNPGGRCGDVLFAKSRKNRNLRMIRLLSFCRYHFMKQKQKLFFLNHPQR